MDDPLFKMQLDFAEMKGMLSVAITSQTQRTDYLSQRMDQVASEHSSLHGRISDKGKLLARHDERLDVNEKDVAEVKERLSNQPPRVMQLITTLAACAALLVSLIATAAKF